MDIFDMALFLTKGVGDVTIAKLIDSCFSAERVFSMSYDELVEGCEVSPKMATAILSRESFRAAEEELSYCEKWGITPLARVDSGYPTALRHIRNAPHILFVQGNVSILTHNLISMVGTRNATEYGERACHKLVADIAKKIYNPVIVSGLAFGVDSFSHEAALEYGVPTVAVLPCSLPNIMPPAHRGLADKILESGGALVSDMHSKQQGVGRSYISRNRIIAGLSQGTILVESDLEGGAMQTMQMVVDMERSPMAVPGRITDQASAGCNFLIATKEVYAVTTAYDIIRVLGWEHCKIKTPVIVKPSDEEQIAVSSSAGKIVQVELDNSVEASELSDLQYAVLSSMISTDPIAFNIIAKMNSIAISTLNSLLVEMELLGYIESSPGALYRRIVSIDGQRS